ncbi:MAG: nucleotide exchange factor GrpE [Candidatus Levybacteria bacterium]|nr:nucleotide exchange factor GrpE [Candidatus Levybacteria bacterium]
MSDGKRNKKQEQTVVDKSEEVEVIEGHALEWENKYKRVLADYQNLEKRVRDERLELVRSSNKELLLKFLPILDTVLLAKQHEQNQNLTIIEDQFFSILKLEGVIKIATVGEHFDPSTMEVVTLTQGQEGIVIQEVRPGYLLYDKLLRPAQVIVGNEDKK